MIFDSSVLIIFSKINRTDILLKLYDSIVITDNIYNECIGKEVILRRTDSEIIRGLAEDKKITIVSFNEELKTEMLKISNLHKQLGEGESSIIALALKKKEKIIAIDEKAGRRACKFYGLRPIGSLRILLESYKKGILSEEEIRFIVKDILKEGFRIGAEVIEEFWDVFQKIKIAKKK